MPRHSRPGFPDGRRLSGLRLDVLLVGHFKIQIRMKMMTRPGEQFVIRRKAYAAIKTAFDANGIKFAFPTVQVAGGTDSAVAAAAQNMLGAAKAEPAG